MSLFEGVDIKELEKLLEPVNRILKGYDFIKLRRTSDVDRIEMWNRIEEARKRYEEDFVPKLDNDLVQNSSSKFSLAKLLLAAVADTNNEDNSIIGDFSREELDLIEDFEKLRVFDILSTNDAIDKIKRKEGGFYELIVDYYEKQYSNLDKILESPDILTELQIAFRDRYLKRQRKIEEIISVAVRERLIDPSEMRKDIEKTVLDKVKESERIREEALRDSQLRIDQLEIKLQDFNSITSDNFSLSARISQLEAELVREGIKKDTALKALESIESDKSKLDQRYGRMGQLLDEQMRSIEKKRRELEEKERELEVERLEYKEKMQEENQRMVEGELKEISSLKNELRNKETALSEEMKDIGLKKNKIGEKLDQITEVISGKPIRFVTREDAKLYELNFIARFDEKMHKFPLKLYNPLEEKNYNIKSWGNHYRSDSREEVFSEDKSYSEIEVNPLNVRSVYLVEEKRFKLVGDKVKKIAIEALSFNHLLDFVEYNFDTSRATLSEFLMELSRSINSAEIGKYLHIIGIASPTGWDERVIKEIESSEFAHNYVSRYVSVCLIDSVTGGVYYNPADERMAGFIEFFKPEFDREKVERVKNHIREIFKKKDYAVFSDVVEETGDDRAIVNKAIYDLERECKGRTRYLKGVGLVIEVGR